LNKYTVYIVYITYLLLLKMSFADLTNADFLAMNIVNEERYAHQLGQPRKMDPMTGSETYHGRVTVIITHTRDAPYLSNSKIRCTQLIPGNPVTVIKDPKHHKWVFIKGRNGQKGWIGIHHVSSAPARVLAPPPALAHVAIHFNVVALVPVTYTYTAPSVQSSQVGYIVPRGSALIVIAVSSCRQWFQLLDNTWIPASWVQ
jgi:hypothetical protein